MAFVGIEIPRDVATALSKNDIPGHRTPNTERHITLVYLDDKIPLEQVIKATVACYSVANSYGPFRIGTALVTSFPKKKGTPIVARILSPVLHKLQSDLRLAMDRIGAHYSKKYPEFKPHVTLAYTDGEFKDTKIDPLVWTVASLVIWGGDEGDERISTRIDLMG